jgi:hypothetical protein
MISRSDFRGRRRNGPVFKSDEDVTLAVVVQGLSPCAAAESRLMGMIDLGLELAPAERAEAMNEGDGT